MPFDIRLCAILASAAVVAQVLPLPTFLRALLATPLVVCLPGYLLLRAVPGAARPWLETAALSTGLSLAFAALTGLALNAWGLLHQLGWALALGGICAALILMARRAPPVMACNSPALDFGKIAMAATGCALALSGLLINRAGYLAHKEFAYTEFWLAPTPGQNNFRYTLGIKNQEQRAEGYQVELWFDGKLLALWNGIGLDDGQSWTRDVQLPVTRPIGKEQRAEARLFKSDTAGEIYRKVFASFVGDDNQRGPALTPSEPASLATDASAFAQERFR